MVDSFIHTNAQVPELLDDVQTFRKLKMHGKKSIYLISIYLCTVFLLANGILMELMDLQPLSVYIRKGKTLCCSIMPQQKVLSIANVYHRLVLLSPGLGGNCRLHDVCL